jgi:hypothetical protein
MAFVERSTVPNMTADQYDQMRQAVQADGPLEGELLHVAGPTPEGWCIIDAWDSQDHCDRAMERYMRVFGDLGLSMEGMSPPQRFDVHALDTRAGAATS